MAPTSTAERSKARAIQPNPVVQSYSELLKSVKSAGLLERRSGFYIWVFVALMLLMAGTWLGFALIGESWYQLLIAAAVGILCTQLSFLAHEAGHKQIFASRRANDWSARILATGVAGISYSWWEQKHGAHHNHPNVISKDPDLQNNALVFHEDAAAERKGPLAFLTKKQGWFFFPLLTLLGLSLQFDSLRFVFSKQNVRHRPVETPILMARLSALPVLAFTFLPIGMAFAFLGVQIMVYGFYMGASFAPNHKGMPVLPKDSRADFLNRQILTSRNISGGRFMDFLLGGLNRQVEHHLFPDMARPQLHKAATIVREFCAKHSVPYTETTLVQSYSIVVRYLNDVGLAAGRGFDCPVASTHGRF
ncbi:fatty acid desaturase family protein [Arthrobacter bambusae]|uniref:fatty acid desaturase family protein n=1 Tax=Arthrobacter bambusae TaxID=1338426 RepID=UPI00277DA09D|nr:acyl-CoA desaturase [Arthrobacter bambusae]MDQ0028666.1 fatty acid desaturase [Arthrobacter bambusae]MDQ0096540.1 fatty acid desaturase [Arthrobacter bambusae]